MIVWMVLAGAVAGASLLMAALWVVQRWRGDAGIVDAAWAGGIGLLTLVYALLLPGEPQRKVLVGVVAGVWSLRLAGYVLKRVWTMPEDGRYQQMKSDWGADAKWRMFRFYQYQAVAMVLFSLPILLALMNSQPVGWLDWVGVVVGVLAIGGESLADWQLDRFRSDPANRGQVCQTGLWRYSRHPNYFFEWLHWWAYVLLAWSWWPGRLALAGPLLMWFFVTRVTGIPPTEAQAIRSRGAAYRAYQQTTNAFFPWFPKQSQLAGSRGSR
jgi:steroid 5-alpha reductase family enzyme